MNPMKMAMRGGHVGRAPELVGLSVLLLLGNAPCAQEVLQSYTDLWSFYNGSEFAWSEDLDGDGHGDLIIGDEQFDILHSPNVGRVVVYSGRTGAVLYNYQGTVTNQSLGIAAGAVEDVSGDSVPDFWGTGASCMCGHLWSGSDGSR